MAKRPAWPRSKPCSWINDVLAWLDVEIPKARKPMNVLLLWLRTTRVAATA
jgi:hypothetical protein